MPVPASAARTGSGAADSGVPGAGPYRVLYVPSWYPSERRPVHAVFLREQAAALAARHRVLCVPPPTPRSLLAGPGAWIDRLATRDRPEGFRELRLAGPNYTPLIPGARERVFERLYERALRASRDYLGGPPDLVHAQVSVEAGYFAARLARRHGLPLVLTEHVSRPELHYALPRGRERFLETMRAADRVLAVSPLQRELLAAAGVERDIDVVPNLIDVGLFQPAETRETRPVRPPLRLMTVGHLIERKGIDVLLEALAAVRTRTPATLDIVGEGDLRGRLLARAQALGVGDAVRFLGEHSRRDVRDLLRRSHVYVCSSLTESFGVAVIEALAVGLPAVVTRCGGPEWFVDDTRGAVVAPGDADALAAGIVGVADRLESFAPGELHGFVAQRFGPAAVVEQITEHYRAALEARAESAREGPDA